MPRPRCAILSPRQRRGSRSPPSCCCYVCVSWLFFDRRRWRWHRIAFRDRSAGTLQRRRASVRLHGLPCHLILGLGCGANLLRANNDQNMRTRIFCRLYTVVREWRWQAGRARIPRPWQHDPWHPVARSGARDLPTSYYAPARASASRWRLSRPVRAHARIGLVAAARAPSPSTLSPPGLALLRGSIPPSPASLHTRKFSFLSRCLPHVPIAIGDARLALAPKATVAHRPLAIDAFLVGLHSNAPSDALGLRHLWRVVTPAASYGHIANKYVDLEPVLAASPRQPDACHGPRLSARRTLGAKHRAATYPSGSRLAGREPPRSSSRGRSSAEWRSIASRADFIGLYRSIRHVIAGSEGLLSQRRDDPSGLTLPPFVAITPIIGVCTTQIGVGWWAV